MTEGKTSLSTALVLYMLLMKNHQGIKKKKILSYLFRGEDRQLVFQITNYQIPILINGIEVMIEYYDPEELLSSWGSSGLIITEGETGDSVIKLTQKGIVVLAKGFEEVDPSNLNDLYEVARMLDFGPREFIVVIRALLVK